MRKINGERKNNGKIERQVMNQNEVVDDWEAEVASRVSLAAVLDEHQIRTMIKKALEEWKNISPESQRQIKEAIKQIKAAFPAIPGFKDPEKALDACPKILVDPLLQMLHSSSPESPLLLLMLGLWEETHRKLEDAVLRFLKADKSRPAILIQARKNCPRGCPKTNEWTSVRKDFVDSQDAEFSSEHVDLMFCYVIHIHFSHQIEEADSLPLNEWTNDLNRLPCDDPLWGIRFDSFCQRIKEIRKSKQAEQSVVGSLKNTLAEVEQKFADDLAFLELKIPSVTRETISPDFDLVRKLTDNLKKALERFSGRRRELKEAKTYTLQKTFEKKQQEAADRVNKVHSELKEMLARQSPPTKSLSTRSASTQPERENRQMKAKEKELRHLQEASKTDKNQIQQLRQENEKLKGVHADNKEEIKKLRASLDTSRGDEKTWREAYQNEMRRKSAIGAKGQKADGKVRSVQEAFEKAERDYPEELLVKLNNDSRRDLKKNRFGKPDEIFKALQWLAIIYRDARMNGAPNPNLDESLRQTCSNWFYSANQSEYAIGKYPNSYKTTIDQKTYDLEPHIGTGTSRNERHTIRIAFAWDSELKKVVVGYVGQHQPTPKKT